MNKDIKMQKELVRLANHLDKIGQRDLADRLDSILKTAALSPEAEQKVVDVKMLLNRYWNAELPTGNKTWDSATNSAFDKAVEGKRPGDISEALTMLKGLVPSRTSDFQAVQVDSESEIGEAAQLLDPPCGEVDFESLSGSGGVEEMQERDATDEEGSKMMVGPRSVTVGPTPGSRGPEAESLKAIFKELDDLVGKEVYQPNKLKRKWEEAKGYSSTMLFKRPFNQLTTDAEKGFVDSDLQRKYLMHLAKNPPLIPAGPRKGKPAPLRRQENRLALLGLDTKGMARDVRVATREAVKDAREESGAQAQTGEAIDSTANVQFDRIEKAADLLSGIFSNGEIPLVRR